MAQASQLSHKLLMNTALPYKTFTTPIDQDPQYVAGRNVMINAKAFCTMRPGFADYLEFIPTTFNHVMRIFAWADWSSRYFVMVVDQLASGLMAVYKYQVGADSSFIQIHAEPTASGIPYSFTTANNYLFFSNPTDCWKWSHDHGKQHWGIVAPAAPVVGLASGSLSAYAGGYYYSITYANSVSGHESSPSPLSACTGNFAGKTMTVTWVASSDPQVDTVNVYRTTDGGSSSFSEMAWAGSAAMSLLSFSDSLPDSQLSATRFAPAAYENDPPPPMQSIISYAGRTWGIVGARLWYSGQEEISNGVPQECFPGASISALDGNFYAYETKLTALAPLTDGVAVFTPNRIQKIEGDSLDTFRRYTILAKRGTVTDYTVKVVGSSVLWFDRASQLWLSDQGEIGRDIRPDLAQVPLNSAQAAIHIAGQQHWICLLDPANSLLYVYDLDVNGWNVPWNVAGSAIESIDLAPGITRLVVALNGTQIRMENPGLFVDGNTRYGAYAVTNTFSLAPDANPDFTAVLHHVAVESNQYQPLTVAVKVDEDPGMLAEVNLNSPNPFGGFNPLTTVTDPPYRRDGQYLIQKNYMGSPDDATPACRRLAVRLDWTTAEPALWALYSIDLAMIPTGR